MSTVSAAAARSPWFHAPWFDFAFLLATPLLTWPLVVAAQGAWGAPLLNDLILLTATGHYFATFVRAYGDRELFARFRTRLVVAPVLLAALGLAMFATGREAALMLVTSGWAFWHWLAQAFGFARIYDAKVGSHAPRTAWLDKLLVIAGFVGAAVLNPGSTAMFGKLFLDAGIALPSAAVFGVVQWIVGVAIAVVGLAYVANLVHAIARGRPWSWQKQLMHVTTIGYYWFAFAWVGNVLVAYVLYELFHDVQYFAITWLTCRQRVKRPAVQPWLAAMFRPGAAAVAGFLLLMLACGGADLLVRKEAPGLRAITLTAALLHYYYDGFLWKAREQALGTDLGIASGLRAAVVPTLRHAARWALFVVPLLGAVAFARPAFSPRERAEMLVAVAPGDFVSRAELGYALTQANELPQALEHYRAAIAANPDYGTARFNFGAALDLAGDLDGARAQYEAALRGADAAGVHVQAHLNLGVLLFVRGDRAGAEPHLRAAAALGPGAAVERMFGLAQRQPANAVERRQRLLTAALELDGNRHDARFELAKAYLAKRRFDEALRHLQVLTQRAPAVASGWLEMAKAQWELGQVDAARASLQQALQREPQNAEAMALQAKFGAR